MKSNTLPNPEILIFDWSGTVSDDRSLVYETNQRLLEAYEYPRLSLDEWRDGRERWNAGNFLAEQLGKSTAGFYKEFGILLATTKAEFGEPQPYPGAVEAFANLTTGRHCEIISSHPQEHLEREVAACGIIDFVQRVRGSVSDKAPVIRAVIERAGVAPEQTLYIGDTLQDMRAAREAGVGAIAVTYGYHSEALLLAEQPDIIVGSLGELADWLSEI